MIAFIWLNIFLDFSLFLNKFDRMKFFLTFKSEILDDPEEYAKSGSFKKLSSDYDTSNDYYDLIS